MTERQILETIDADLRTELPLWIHGAVAELARRDARAAWADGDIDAVAHLDSIRREASEAAGKIGMGDARRWLRGGRIR